MGETGDFYSCLGTVKIWIEDYNTLFIKVFTISFNLLGKTDYLSQKKA